MRFARSAAVVLAGLVAAPGRTATPELSPTRLAGVSFRIIEVAEDERVDHAGGAHEVVDVRSRLSVVFDSANVSTPPTPEQHQWELLRDMLTQANELMARHTEVARALAALPPVESAALERVDVESRALGKSVTALMISISKTLGKAEFDNIDKKTRENPKERRGFLWALADWISAKMRELSPRIDGARRSAGTARVQVLAFLEPTGADRRPLHVENYDELPEGKLNPVPRNGLRLATQEEAQLQQEVAVARQVAEAINTFQAHRGDLATEFTNLNANVRMRLQKVITRAGQAVSGYEDHLKELRASFSSGSTFLMSSDQHVVATFEEGEATIRRLRDDLSALRNGLDGMEGTPDVGLVGFTRSVAGLADTVTELQTGISSLARQRTAIVGALRERVASLVETERGEVASRIDAFDSAVERDLRQAVADLDQVAPITSELMKAWRDVASNLKSANAAGQALASAPVPVILHEVGDLPPGTVDLRRSGAQTGDYLSLKVSVVDGASGRVLQEGVYDFKIHSVGWYRQYSGQLVFDARFTGPAGGNFQADPAVLVTWRRGARPGSGMVASVLDATRFGIGFHASSINQGVTAPHVGAGIAATILDDMFSAGAGWDLFEKQHRSYYFVGIGLLDVLNKISKWKL